MPGAGAARAWIGMQGSGGRSSPVSSRAGHPSKWRDAWPWRRADRSSPTRASTVSSTPRWLGRRDYSWRHYLPRGKSKRGWRGRRGGSSASFIAHRVPLAHRPQEAAYRQTPGHWEADLMAFGRRGPVVLALHERYSRLLVAARPQGKASSPIADAMMQVLNFFPPAWRQTVTFDNGTEFARHHALHALGIQTFFCDTHSPWQKGGVENAIGRMRRCLPRKTDLATVSDARFTQLIQAYNNTPRKCLGYRTPAEIFAAQVLHLKCEFTFLLSQERRYPFTPSSSKGRGEPTPVRGEPVEPRAERPPPLRMPPPTPRHRRRGAPCGRPSTPPSDVASPRRGGFENPPLPAPATRPRRTRACRQGLP